MCLMSETSETPTVRTHTATAPAPAVEAAPYGTPRVFRFAAWVAIVAGIVFIVAIIFFTGYTLGRHSGHGGFHHGHKHHATMHHRMGPGGPGGAGGAPGGPGGGTGGAGGPGAPSTTSPSGGPTAVRPSAGVGQLPPSVFRSATTSSGAVGEVPTVAVLAG